MRNGRRGGTGTIVDGDGSKYEDEFMDDFKEGAGFVIKANGTRSEGMFKKSKWEGFVVQTDVDGARYEGEYRDGQRSGLGILYRTDGTRAVLLYINGVLWETEEYCV